MVTTVLLCVVVQVPAGRAGDKTDRSIPEGVVVERFGEDSALAKAGLQAGDVVLSWERLASPSGARGEVRSVFDWEWLEVEEAPRGAVKLRVERDGERTALIVAPGTWAAEVRPRLPDEVLTYSTRAKERVEAGEIPAAVELLRKAAAKARADAGPVRCWISTRMGEAWVEAQEWERAHAAYQEALREARNPEARVAIWAAVGAVFQQQHEFEAAREAFRSALDIRRATWGTSLGLAIHLDQLGDLAFEQQDLRTAESYYQRALHIREKLAPEDPFLPTNLNNLGIVAAIRGEMVVAREHFKRGVAVAEHLTPNSIQLARALHNLGNAAQKCGDLELARNHLERSLAILEKLAPDSVALTRPLHTLGLIALLRREDGMGEAYSRRALAILEKQAPSSIEAAKHYNQLGSIAFHSDDLDVAEARFQRALAILEERVPGSLDLAFTLRSLGRVFAARREFDLADSYYRRALAIQEKLAPKSNPEIGTLNMLGNLYRLEDRPQVAARFFRRSIDSLEGQVGKLGDSQDVNSSFRAMYGYIYRDALEFFLSQNQTEEAFDILESSRARSLLVMLAQRDVVFSADVLEELDRSRRQIAVRYDRIQRRMARLSLPSDEDKIEILGNELRSLDREKTDIETQIRQTSPKLAELHYPQPLNLEGVQEALDLGTVMLSYSIGKKQTDLFVVTPGGFEVKTIELGEERLREDVEHFRRLIEEAQPRSRLGDRYLKEHLPTTARWLYRKLIGPAAEQVQEKDRILIIPDDSLHFLPFSALIRETQESSADGKRDWQYLVEWKPIHTALSATLYAELRKSRRRFTALSADHPAAVVAFGDPLYPPTLQPTNAESIQDVRVRAAVSRDLFRWSPLPYSRYEVDQIGGLFPNTRLYLGEEATEERVKSIGGEARILHFATHGHLDDRFPLNSALVLTMPEDFPENRENGLLQAWEIFESVRLDADLVVLSACQSGLGQERGGEGLIGLTRAFRYAGARTVASTLWSVADRATAELMGLFYRHLKAGKSKDEALRTAQIELIRRPLEVWGANGRKEEIDASAPYFWAAFQLIGDWR